ncbi:hypothetical protein JCM33374_g5197 [Metschnikowia sp. JCM 33374]|nr:hypothetical protein JCM33374_g5197 [Metschnikowia sp. JCM 33374]
MPFNPFSIKEQDGNFTLAPSASSLGVSDDDTKVSLESTCSHIATAINGNLFSPGSSYINQELYPRSEPEPCPLSPFHPPDYLPLNDVFGLNGVSFAALSESEGLPFAGGLDDGCPFDFLSIPANHADPIDIHAQIQGNKVNKSDSQPEAARAKSCTTTRSQDATVSATITPLSKAASDLAHNDFKTRTSPSTILEPSGTPTLVSSNSCTHQQDPQHEISCLNVLKSQEKQNMRAKSPGIKVLPETKELFLKLTPSIGKVTTKTLREFLVNFMKTYHHDIPLDRLSHLLFHGNFSNSEWKPTGEYSVTESKASTKTKLIAIQLCHLIVEQLQTPHPLMSGGVGSELPFSLPPTTNSHELARSFLAIKIILASVKKAEGDMSHHYTLPRYLVYKVYYIVCQNLIQRSPDIRDFSTQSLILSQSSFGKLTSLIFSHLKTKRLGSRGKSKYNFVGVTWDTTFVGKDVIRLLELDLPQIRQIFENGSQLRHSRKTPNTPNKKKCAVPGSVEGAPKSLPSLTWKKPGYSYINSSQTFPAANCAPRIWESVPGKVPQQSPWALEHMQRSIVALKLYHIELDPFIRRFNAGKFSDDNKDNLVNTFSRALGVLQKAKAPKQHVPPFILYHLGDDLPRGAWFQYRSESNIKNTLSL